LRTPNKPQLDAHEASSAFNWMHASASLTRRNMSPLAVSPTYETGSIEGTKQEVQSYIARFRPYEFLYLKNLQQAYADFVQHNSSLDAFELELKTYMMIEQDVLKFSPVHNIGALSLDMQPLKMALKAEAARWKIQFAENLHKHGLGLLVRIMQYMRDTTLRLNRKVEDLEDVRLVMVIQQDIRSKEAEVDTIMTPIEDIYALLSRWGKKFTIQLALEP